MGKGDDSNLDKVFQIGGLWKTPEMYIKYKVVLNHGSNTEENCDRTREGASVEDKAAIPGFTDNPLPVHDNENVSCVHPADGDQQVVRNANSDDLVHHSRYTDDQTRTSPGHVNDGTAQSNVAPSNYNNAYGDAATATFEFGAVANSFMQTTVQVCLPGNLGRRGGQTTLYLSSDRDGTTTLQDILNGYYKEYKCQVACTNDCTEYDREDGKTSCGYCGCPPGEHREVTAPQETSDAPSAASTSSTSSAFHKISDKRKESFGWVKLAKAGKTKFGNSILPAFHEAYYPVSQNPVTFRRDFLVERDREFSVKEEASKISRLIDFIRGDNSAAAGRFLSTSFRIKGEKDSTTIQNNTDKLKALQERLLQIEKELQTHDATLFKSGGRHVKQGRTTMHAFNTEQLDCISNLKATVKATLEKLEDALKRVKRIYKVERTTRQSRKKSSSGTRRRRKSRRGKRRE
uniref:Uncharacterized protein n=1 Tax=Branchiostoma floridae TaxID=7739 RepID=C4A052_BRAFL|eukprot:XP_002585809.1 hypothetical protein BRAFLDRAFT_111064 [Branchiostoma floridae]